jgi:hypothetical protein
MSRIQKPRYLDPLGDPRLGELSVSPPFLFHNVTARVFPLRANMAVLKRFCDNYLNMDVPPSMVHYAPALPYVYLMVLNYGSMAPASVRAQNAGWVGQHEVTFTVPLQRWRVENGLLAFKDWATVSPFIYVDDDLSLNTGREVYGWNKAAGDIESTVPLWLTDPRAKLRQFDLSVGDYGEPDAGGISARRALLHIDSDPPPSFGQFPPDPRNPWLPMWAAPNAIANGASLLSSLLDMAAALRVRGYEVHRSVDSLKAMAGLAGDKLRTLLPQMLPGREPRPQELAAISEAVASMPMLFLDDVTLKQFRNPEDPSLACYQALVNSRMGVDRLNRAGLLGDLNLLRGDTSGGYSLEIHQLTSEPIISTLGLEVSSWSDPDSPDAVATLKPVLPYWLDVDLLYGAGEVICSRAPWGAAGPTGGWIDEEQPEPRGVNDLPSAVASGQTSQAAPPLYNTTLGAATQPLAGPFTFPDVTLQVYPLLADAAKIRAIVDNHFNKPLAQMFKPGTEDGSQVVENGWRFEAFGSYVYMMVTVYGDELGQQWSSANSLSGSFDREVTFCIPVKWYDKDGNLLSVAMMEPFTYSNSGRGVATDREVNGYNSILATIDSPKDVWMQPDGPISKRRFLSVETELIPILNLGQKAEVQTLIEIDELDILPQDADARWRDVATTWGRNLIDELKRKTVLAADDLDDVINAKALALELLAHGQSFNRLIYKQYRDSLDPETACYQALVHATSTITSIYDMREIEANCHVRFHRHPSQPIADALGLKIKLEDSDASGVVDIVQPERPFWMRIAMREDLATVACYRASDEPWRVVHPWFTLPPAAHKPANVAKSADAPVAPGTKASEPPPTFGGKPYFRRFGNARAGPWLARTWPQGLPLRLAADAAIVFPGKGDVERWLPHRLDGEREGANLHLDVKNRSADWLRQALVNELSWVRICLEPADDAPPVEPAWIASLAASADPRVRAFATCPLSQPLQLGLIRNLTEQYSIQELWAIKGAMDVALLSGGAPALPSPTELDPGAPGQSGAVGSWSDQFYKDLQLVATSFDAFFKASTDGIEKNGLAWGWDGFLDGQITNFSFKEAVANFEKLPRRQRRAFILSLPPGAQTLLSAAVAFIHSPEFTSANAFQDYSELELGKLQNVRTGIEWAGKLADVVDLNLLDWLCPSRWRRLSIADAGRTIQALDEVQLVVDNILSSEWENRGKTRWANPRRGRKPDECIPDGPDIALHAAEQGLIRWVEPETGQDSDLWVAELPEAAKASPEGPETSQPGT